MAFLCACLFVPLLNCHELCFCLMFTIVHWSLLLTSALPGLSGLAGTSESHHGQFSLTLRSRLSVQTHCLALPNFLQQQKASSRHLGFPSALVLKHLTVNVGDIRDTVSVPGLERSPGGGHGNPLQYPLLKSQGRNSLVGYSPQGYTEKNTTQDTQAIDKDLMGYLINGMSCGMQIL